MANMSFDTAIKRLEEIVAQLESGEKTLEQSMKLYEEGAKLSALCAKKLDDAQQKITLLSEMDQQEELDHDSE